MSCLGALCSVLLFHNLFSVFPSRTQTIAGARAVKQAGIHLISLGIGDWLDMHELFAMASYPVSRNMPQVQDFSALGTVVKTIKDAVCDTKEATFICLSFLFFGECVDFILLVMY